MSGDRENMLPNWWWDVYGTSRFGGSNVSFTFMIIRLDIVCNELTIPYMQDASPQNPWQSLSLAGSISTSDPLPKRFWVGDACLPPNTNNAYCHEGCDHRSTAIISLPKRPVLFHLTSFIWRDSRGLVVMVGLGLGHSRRMLLRICSLTVHCT